MFYPEAVRCSRLYCHTEPESGAKSNGFVDTSTGAEMTESPVDTSFTATSRMPELDGVHRSQTKPAYDEITTADKQPNN